MECFQPFLQVVHKFCINLSLRAFLRFRPIEAHSDASWCQSASDVQVDVVNSHLPVGKGFIQFHILFQCSFPKRRHLMADGILQAFFHLLDLIFHRCHPLHRDAVVIRQPDSLLIGIVKHRHDHGGISVLFKITLHAVEQFHETLLQRTLMVAF